MKNWQNPEIEALDIQETFGGPIFTPQVDYDYFDGEKLVEWLGEDS